jgi:RND family efflux transporter MFP subunit
VATARASSGTSDLVLPGTIQGARETAIYPRATGYVRRWRVDMGAHVRAGDVLAEVETPELDQELDQARAAQAQSEATMALARTTLDRWTELVKEDAATRQEFDEKQAAYTAAQANVRAAHANVDRLSALKRFANVVAPFAGVVTARNVEVGMLVSSSASAGARPLYTLAQTDTMRMLVNVPQSSAAEVTAGTPVEIAAQELSASSVKGTVARTAEAIDPASRTLLTEIRIPNAGRALLPGMYAEAKLHVRRAVPSLVIPATTLVLTSDGPMVAVVKDGRVHLQRLTLGRDLGAEVEVTSGLAEGAQLIVNPSDEIVEGARVRVR